MVKEIFHNEFVYIYKQRCFSTSALISTSHFCSLFVHLSPFRVSSRRHTRLYTWCLKGEHCATQKAMDRVGTWSSRELRSSIFILEQTRSLSFSFLHSCWPPVRFSENCIEIWFGFDHWFVFTDLYNNYKQQLPRCLKLLWKRYLRIEGTFRIQIILILDECWNCSVEWNKLKGLVSFELNNQVRHQVRVTCCTHFFPRKNTRNCDFISENRRLRVEYLRELCPDIWIILAALFHNCT